MAITDVTICNSALIKIGSPRISSLAESSKAAIACNEQYSKIRDEVLANHPWSFALKRASLSPLVGTPPWGFNYKFQLPSDCLRPWKLEDSDTEFKWEGKTLLCDDDTLNLLYIAQIVDTSYYTSLFAEIVSVRLAAELAYYLVNSLPLQQEMISIYQAKLKEARSLDSQSSGTPDPVEADDWIRARF